jgi:uncharacterized protein YhjY with autotransporter beta-barrel domain
LRRNGLIFGVLMASAAWPAFAVDLVVSGTNNTSSLFTNTLGDGTPGNITLSLSSLITTTGQGATLTINSNNTITNEGTVQNTFAGGGAIGVHILGGNTGTYTQLARGIVNVTGSGAGNAALLVSGSGPFVGSIDLRLGSAVLSRGLGARAVDIKTPIVGDFGAYGTINGADAGANGIVVGAPITGRLTVGGSVFVTAFTTAAQYSGTRVDPVTGSALAIGADITGGILFDGPGDSGPAVSRSSLQSSSTLPTVVIAPSAAGAGGSNITIGMRTIDSDTPSFSLINRGSVVNKQTDPGISTVGLRIGENSTAAAANTVTLPGGVYIRGQVSAEARTDNLFATSVAPAPANATAFEIGAGARLRDGGSRASQAQSGSTESTIKLDTDASSINDFYRGMTVTWNGQERLITDYDGATKVATVGAFRTSAAAFTAAPGAGDDFRIKSAAIRNDGGITAYVFGTQSGTATGALIQPFGDVPSFINAGTIKAESYSTRSTTSDLVAYGIRDLSGTLTEITNTGSILAIAGFNPSGSTGGASPLDDRSQKGIAVDLSAGTANQTILSYGTITGDVRFGSGNNLLVVEGVSAGVSGAISAKGAGTVEIRVSQEGRGGSFLTNDADVTNVSIGANGQVIFLLTSQSLGQTALSATGDVTFAAGSVLSVLPGNFLPSGEYTLASAGGNIHFDNPSATAKISVPFLFNATIATDNGTTIANDGKTLKLTLTRKTANELGLQGNGAAIYESLAAAAVIDNTYGAALMNLANNNQVQTTLESALPDLAGGVRALAISFTDQSTGVVGARQRALLTAPVGSRDEFHFWAQEFYNNVQQKATAGSNGFGGAGQGLAFGAEWGALATGRYGLGLAYFASQQTERHPRETKTNGDWFVASAYAAWRAGDFFFAPQINAGLGEMKTRRTLFAGSLARIASATFKSQLVAGGFTTGYILEMGNFQIIPTFALDGLYLRTADYSERNAGGMGLTLIGQSDTSMRGFAGLVGKGSFEYEQGTLVPQILAGYSREFLKDPSAIDGYFAAAPGTPFHLTGPVLDPSRLIGGVSLGYVLRNWSAGVNYDATSTTGLLAQSATVSISSRF